MAVLGIVFIALVLYSDTVCCFAIQQDIIVSPDCSSSSLPDCTDLDSALSTLRPNTNLQLQTGQHVLRQYHGSALWNLVNISLIGSSRDAVSITCLAGSGTGLAFINVTNLVVANITINSCGLTNSSLKDVTDFIDKILHVHFMVPDTIQVGILLAQCTNLVMSNCLITNTSGIGMLGINIIGSSTLFNVDFTYNIRPQCTDNIRTTHSAFLRYTHCLGRCGEIGGGAYFIYEDMEDHVVDERIGNSTLVIDESMFEYNADCSYAAYANIAYQYYISFSESTYIVGGGGGLAIFTPQTTYTTDIRVTRSVFKKNDARSGAGAHIGLFGGFVSNVVKFSNCCFDSNGLPSATNGLIRQSYAKGGAGVAVFMDLLRHSDGSESPSALICRQCKNVSFEDTVFVSNSAQVEGGGLLCYSLSRNFHTDKSLVHYNSVMLFRNTIFRANSAKYGSAMYVTQRTALALDGALILNISNTTIERNMVADTRGSSRTDVSAMDLRGINAWITSGVLLVQENNGSGVHLESSGIFMKPDTSLVIQGNRAYRGGGILMEGTTPGLIASRGCTIRLCSNTAITEGGAIHFSRQLDEELLLQPLSEVAGCFIFTSAHGYSPEQTDMFNSNITIAFLDNCAPVGSMVYGSSLNSCSWAKELDVPDDKLYMELHKNYSATFRFSKAPYGIEQISGLPHHLQIPAQTIPTYPGKRVVFNVSIEDIYLNEIDTIFSSGLQDDDNRHNLSLGHKNFWYHTRNDDIPVSLYGEEANVSAYFFSADNLLSTSVTFNIQKCPIGFYYDGNVTHRCKCSVPEDSEIECNESSVVLTVPAGKWLGCLDSTKCTTLDDLVLMYCFFGHCSSTRSTFDTFDTSKQCAPNSFRSGIRCSRCADGYNAPLSDVQCDKCSNRSILVSVSFVVVYGLLIMLVLTILGSTTDNGWIYMVTFFSSILFPYNIYESEITGIIKYVIAPVELLGLELGHIFCFFDGLTPLLSVAMRLLLPAYLYVLMALLAILWRFSSFIQKYFSPLKTFGALLFVTYSSVLKTCFLLLAPTLVKKLDGADPQLRWLIDPSQKYFHGVHSFLVTLCFFIFIAYLVPFILLLFGYKLVYKRFKRLRPFLDALYAPYKPRFYLWAGVRLFFQNFVLIFSLFINPSSFINSYTTALLLTVIPFLYTQSMLKPFKRDLINIFDNVMVALAIAMHQFAYFVINRIFVLNNKSELDAFEFAYLCITMVSAFIIILVTFLLYCKPAAKSAVLGLKFCRCTCQCPKTSKRKRHVTFDTVEGSKGVRKGTLSVRKRATHSSFRIPRDSNNHYSPWHEDASMEQFVQ